MKKNGNNLRTSDYYIGLDVGTNSVGWAVTDVEYHVKKANGNAMWGVRLFEEAKTAEERRAARTARRLNQRKRQRLELLDMLFNEEISKIDPSFFIRLKESALFSEDKSICAKYPIFNDKNYTDKDYFKAYPTIYHLRKELLNSPKPHDIRLIYLALHHILKSRGHSLFNMETTEEYKSLDMLLNDLNCRLLDEYAIEIPFKDRPQFVTTLKRFDLSLTAKKKLLKDAVGEGNASDSLNLSCLVDLLAGAKVNFGDLFCDDELKTAEMKSVTLNSDIAAESDAIEEAIGSDRLDFICSLKEIFDSAKLAQMLGNHQYISEAKVEQYETNKSDLSKLKKYVKENAPEKYKEIFSAKKDKLNNYAAYSGKTLASGDYACKKTDDFCKYLLSALPHMKDAVEYSDIYNKICNYTFLPKLKGSDNSVIPCQLQQRELKKILENASVYFPFLNKKDAQGISTKDKIISIFDFRIPYYVGPLNTASPRSWVVRTNEKIYPWNFEKVVDVQKSSENFIMNLISKCPYSGEDVLPKESLLFSKYCVLNEINPLAVNGKNISVSVKQEIFEDLFVRSGKKVTKKSIKTYLLKKSHIEPEDEISGIDDTVKSKLQSYRDCVRIFGAGFDETVAEDIIKAVTIFGEDKKMLKNWIKNKYPTLSKEQVDMICRLRYNGWGGLSEALLKEIYSSDKNDKSGEAHTIIDMLYITNCNLMQLLSSDYQFNQNAAAYRQEKFGAKDSVKEMVDEMYISPSIKRSLLQTVKIVDEIVDIQKSAPKKIFIEVARDKNEDNTKKRTVSRKEKLQELYKACKSDYAELLDALNATDENDLRKDALYLYYTQFGRCMYSGEPIDIEKLKADSGYDVDHIFPQSKIKDDSLDNRVLVKRTFNENKGNKYPINADWRKKMQPFWYQLKEKGLISAKKYERLIRDHELTEEELSSFVARQIVQTRQSTKALAEVMNFLYQNAGTKIVYSKAGNVSDFRQDNGFIKCRDINDLHHAKDAYLNIVVGNVYDTKFTSQFFKNIKNERYSLNKVFAEPVNGAWAVQKSFETVSKAMAKNNILVTRKPYAQKGALFDLQIMPAGKGQLAIVKGRSIEKYGGYNKVAGSYFCVVEHLHKKARIRTIEPVYIYARSLFENDPEKYCTDILGLVEPHIVCRQIFTDQLLEIDGRQLYICGRTGNQFVCKHNYQLAVSKEHEKYIKDLVKYVNQSLERKAADGIKLAPNSNISEQNNFALYTFFAYKLTSTVYNRLFTNVLSKLEDSVESFKELSLFKQSVLLLEILKLFRCDRQASDFTLIGGAKSSGIIQINKSLAKVTTAHLINQSVTGLYETKVDLLK